MNQDQKKQDEELANVDNIDIQPLSDEDLDSVVGGMCSVWCCTSVKQTQSE